MNFKCFVHIKKASSNHNSHITSKSREEKWVVAVQTRSQICIVSPKMDKDWRNIRGN